MSETFVKEEVSFHISSFSNFFEALKKLKKLYGSHSKLEFVQLMIIFFSLELRNHDHLGLASEVRSIMHDIKTTSVQIDITIIAYVNPLYPTYSIYLDSLQESGILKEITFDFL